MLQMVFSSLTVAILVYSAAFVGCEAVLQVQVERRAHAPFFFTCVPNYSSPTSSASRQS